MGNDLEDIKDWDGFIIKNELRDYILKEVNKELD